MIDMSLRQDTMSPLSTNFDVKVHIATAPAAGSAAASSAVVGADALTEPSGDLKSKKRKRSSHELKAETIPLNDARRSYPRIFATMMNRCQSEDIALRLASIADPNNFVFVLNCKDGHDSICPRVRELKGIECTARFFGAFFQTTPDSIFVMKDYHFFKRSTSSQIHCNFELTGSIIYQMIVQNATCIVQSSSAPAERVGSEEDHPEHGEGSVNSRAESPADLEREGGEDSDTTPTSPVESIQATEECELAEPSSVKEEGTETAKIVGLDALAHVAELLFANQQDKLRHSSTATLTPVASTPAAAAPASSAPLTSAVLPSRDSAADLQGKRSKKPAGEASEKDKEGTGAAVEVSSLGQSNPTLTPAKLSSAAQRGGMASANAGAGGFVRKEKRAIIGATVLTNSKITLESSAVAAEGSPSSCPVVNTAVSSSKLFADKNTTFSLGDKVSEVNGHNFTCAGQAIFYVNPSKRVERMELIYEIDHTAPNVMSKPSPAIGLLGLPSLRNGCDHSEGLLPAVVLSSGSASASSTAQYSPGLNASLSVSPLSASLASSNNATGLPSTIGMLGHRDDGIKEEKA